MRSITSDTLGGLGPTPQQTNASDSDMSFNFLGLPPEIRDRVYEHLLIQQKPIRLLDRRQELTVGLLRVNKLVHREASALLYTKNHFNLSADPDHEEAEVEFLKTIGKENAGNIKHIRMRLPWVENFDIEDEGLTLEDFCFQDDSDSLFTIMKRTCTKLRSLTMSRSSIRDFDFSLVLLRNPEMAITVIKRFNAKIRAIPSLQEIIVEVKEFLVLNDAREQMEACGWRLKTQSLNDGRNDNPNKTDIDWDSQTWISEDFEDSEDSEDSEDDLDDDSVIELLMDCEAYQ